MKWLATVFIVLVLSSCHADVTEENIHEKLLQSLNTLRAKGCTCGQDTMPAVGSLTWNDTLEHIAHEHALEMYSNNYLSHQSLDGTPPIIRAQEAGYTGTYVGENIARGYDFVDQVMKAWIASEDHCKNMMDSTYTEMGASKVSSYWDIDFGGR